MTTSFLRRAVFTALTAALTAACDGDRRDPPRTSQAPLSHVPPVLADLADPGADSAFAGAPPPRFRMLARAYGRDPEPVVYTATAVAGWRSIVSTRIQRQDAEPATAVDDWLCGPWDLYLQLHVHLAHGLGDPRPVITRYRVSAVRGRLFPLAVGNRLRFLEVQQAETDDRIFPPRSQPVEMRVIGVLGAYTGSNPPVPGPVYVIETREGDGLYPDTIHYAPAIGAAVRLSAHDQHLVSWR